MFFFLSKILDVLLSPLTWAILLAAATVPWRRRSARRWRRRRAFGAAAIVVILVFSSSLVADGMWGALENSAVSTYDPARTYDAVILLGGVGDEEVWAERKQLALNDNVERLTATNEILRDGHARVAILSGAAMRPGGLSEARELATFLLAWGIGEDRIVLEERARNTRENAVYSAEIVRARGFSRVLVVTSAFHVPRAADCFRAVGLEVDFLPVDYRAHRPHFELEAMLPRTSALDRSSAAIREIAGRWIYRARGYGR
ncbi:MAG TPA: YdcF family protein [Labilithrix sp.]